MCTSAGRIRPGPWGSPPAQRCSVTKYHARLHCGGCWRVPSPGATLPQARSLLLSPGVHTECIRCKAPSRAPASASQGHLLPSTKCQGCPDICPHCPRSRGACDLQPCRRCATRGGAGGGVRRSTARCVLGLRRDSLDGSPGCMGAWAALGAALKAVLQQTLQVVPPKTRVSSPPGQHCPGYGSCSASPRCINHPAPGTLHCAPGTRHCAPGTRHCAPCTLHHVPCTVPSVPCTLRPAPCSPHPAPCSARGLLPWSCFRSTVRRRQPAKLVWTGTGRSRSPHPSHRPPPCPQCCARLCSQLPLHRLQCHQAFAELVQGQVPAESKLCSSPGWVSSGPWRQQQELSMLVTGTLATAPSCCHPSWWTGTSPSRSRQLRGGQRDMTGVAAVRERVWTAKPRPCPPSPCAGTTPEQNTLGMGCLGLPVEHFILGGTERRDQRMV